MRATSKSPGTGTRPHCPTQLQGQPPARTGEVVCGNAARRHARVPAFLADQRAAIVHLQGAPLVAQT